MVNPNISRRDFLKLAGVTSGGLALTACGLDPTKFPDPTATAAAEALSTGSPPEFPIPLEVISTTEPIPGHPSVVDGLNIGEVTPNNVVGMIPGYESTGINTLYNPNDPSMLITKQNGEQVEAIPPRAFGIDQDQLIHYFNAKEIEGGEIMGDYQGASLTLKNGIWKAATGETFIPFIKAEPNTDAVYLVMDAKGGIQKVDITGKAVGSPMPMFETPQAIAARMGFEKVNDVVDVEMNKNGSLSFITKEARPTEKDPSRVVQIINEASFIGEPEDLRKAAAADAAAVAFSGALLGAGLNIAAEDIKKNFTIMRVDGLDPTDPTKQKKKNYDVATVAVEDEKVGGDYPLMIRVEGAGWEESNSRRLAEMAGLTWGNSTTISYLQSWSSEYGNVTPIMAEHGNNYVIAYDLTWWNQSFPENSLRPDKDTFNYKQLDLIMKFAKEHNLSLGGQMLLEVLPKTLPQWLTKLQDKKEILRYGLTHISTLVSKYPQVSKWCIAGELENQYTPNFWAQKLGLEDLGWLKQSFEVAHNANPNAKLYYSDFDIEYGGKKADRVFEIIKGLKESGTPIHEIAFQMHVEGRDFVDPSARLKKIQALKTQIARYKEIRIEVIVPEMDINMAGITPDQSERFNIQAQIEYDIVLALLESGVTDINHFGGTDKLNWKQDPSIAGSSPDANPTPFTDTGALKPNYFAAERAIIAFLSK